MRRKNQLGYTLIELLAVISILTVVSAILVTILYSTLRGVSRTRITTEVSQNGDYAVSVIRSIISDSRNITQIDGNDISNCIGVAPSTNSITFKRIDGGTTTVSCQGITIASNSASIANSSSVNISNCSFSCNQYVNDPYSIPVVNVSFTVSDKGTGLFESKSSSTFNVSSSLRTYSP